MDATQDDLLPAEGPAPAELSVPRWVKVVAVTACVLMLAPVGIAFAVVAMLVLAPIALPLLPLFIGDVGGAASIEFEEYEEAKKVHHPHTPHHSSA